MEKAFDLLDSRPAPERNAMLGVRQLRNLFIGLGLASEHRLLVSKFTKQPDLFELRSEV